MLTYRVTYAHENKDAADAAERHGFAMQEIQVDHEITKQDEFIEIARQIGREKGYTKVAVVKVEVAVPSEEEEEEDVD